MGPRRARLLAAIGPFTAIAASSASAVERASALHRLRALAVLTALAREAKSGERGSLIRSCALLGHAPPGSELGGGPTHALQASLARALERGELLFVPGWTWATTPAPTPRSAAAPEQAADEATASATKPARERAPTYELLFAYRSNTGHCITDDHGFELRHPSGAVERGKLNNGQLQRRVAEPGTYELRARFIRSARWSSSAAAPHEPVTLIVSTQNFPDGTPVDIRVRPAHSGARSGGARIQTEVNADRAVATWAYEQAVGGRAREELQFEVTIGKKRARSDILTIRPRPAGTPRGAQERLRARGYDPGPPADAVSDPLRAALRSFQEKSAWLLAHGELDPFTVELLDDPFA